MNDFVSELRARRRVKYGAPDIREFAAMMKEGALNRLPLDLAPYMVKYRPQTDDELSLWIHVCLEQQGLTCNFTREANTLQTDLKDTCSHLQYLSDMFFDRAGDVIVLGNRGAGKTLTFAVSLLIESLFKDGYEMAHLGAIEDQARRCYRYFQRMTGHPLFQQFLDGKPTSTRTCFVNGSSVEILVGTMAGVNCIHGDSLIGCYRDCTKYPYGVPIRDLVEKDFIIPAVDEETGVASFRKARGVYSGKSKCLDIRFAREDTSSSPQKLEYTKLICTPDHPILMVGSHKYRSAKSLCVGDLVQSSFDSSCLCSQCCDSNDMDHPESIASMGAWTVLSVREYDNGSEQDVYDVIVASDSVFGHNFPCNGLTVHNSPHPVASQLDEVELMDWNIMQEAFNMARSAKGYRSSTRLTSTRKKASGTMQRLLDEASQRGFKVYQWNLWDTIATCPLRTNDKGEVDDAHTIYSYTDKKGDPKSCYVYESCMDCTMLPACHGQAKTSNAGPNAVVAFDDAVKLYKTLDPDVWEAQVICVKPGRSNLVYPMFDKDIHVIDYEYMLREKHGSGYSEIFDVELDTYAGQDAGFGCPATIFLQLMDDPETGEQTVVIFDELYEKNIAPSKYVEDFLIPRQDLYNVQEWFCDPSNSQQLMAEMDLQDLYTVPGLKNVDEGIDAVKALFSLGRLLIDKKCKNLIWELGRYEKQFNGKPKKVDDHLVDALRFGVNGVGLYNQVLDEVYK